MMMAYRIGGAWLAAAITCGGAAHAGVTFALYNQTANAGVYNSTASLFSDNNFGPGGFDETRTSGDALANITVRAFSSFDPAPNTRSSVVSSGADYGRGTSSVFYQFEATLGANRAGVTEIPAVLMGHLTTYAAGAQVRSHAAIGFTGLGSNPYTFDCGVGYDASGCRDQDFTYAFALVADPTRANIFDGYVSLSTSATSTVFGASFDTSIQQADAFIDPIIYLDQAFLRRHPGTTLNPDGSALFDIPPGGGATVPEPAAWALMIAGFGLAGTALRRRRAAVAV